MTKASRTPRPVCPGFTLIETAVVVIIVGVILAIGTSAWITMSEARKIQATRQRIAAAKNCLINRMAISHLYPSYSSNYGSPNSNEVDACMKGVTGGDTPGVVDGWGQPILFLEGVNATGSMQGGCLVVDETLPDEHPCGAEDPTTPIPGAGPGTSSAFDKDGNEVEDVAFLLISYGQDRAADATNSGYAGSFDIPNDQFANILDPNDRPDFTFEDANPDEDDIVLIVTYPDILAALARSGQ